jgi:catechol 2,3-dioxygenase-like lactoylglutathione lyase family enzyme
MFNQYSQPPEISGLHHIAVDVSDLQAAIDFYRNILGLAELPTPDDVKDSGILWFDLKNGRALHLVENKELSHTGKAHFAITVEDIEVWRQFLAEKNVEIFSPLLNLYNAERFFLRDPSGNRVELVKWLD